MRLPCHRASLTARIIISRSRWLSILLIRLNFRLLESSRSRVRSAGSLRKSATPVIIFNRLISWLIWKDKICHRYRTFQTLIYSINFLLARVCWWNRQLLNRERHSILDHDIEILSMPLEGWQCFIRSSDLTSIFLYDKIKSILQNLISS